MRQRELQGGGCEAHAVATRCRDEPVQPARHIGVRLAVVEGAAGIAGCEDAAVERRCDHDRDPA